MGVYTIPHRHNFAVVRIPLGVPSRRAGIRLNQSVNGCEIFLAEMSLLVRVSGEEWERVGRQKQLPENFSNSWKFAQRASFYGWSVRSATGDYDFPDDDVS